MLLTCIPLFLVVALEQSTTMLRSLIANQSSRVFISRFASSSSGTPAPAETTSMRTEKYSSDSEVKWTKSKWSRKRTDVYYRPGLNSAGYKLLQEAWGDQLEFRPLKRSDLLSHSFFNTVCDCNNDVHAHGRSLHRTNHTL